MRTQDHYSRRDVWLLLALGLFYLAAYFSHPALPGNNSEYPLGWWGWFDQGEYLKAAKAIASSNWSSDNFYYPPLYPALGALLIKINPMHAFAILNLACFLTFAHYYIAIAKRIVGWVPAAISFLIAFASSKHTIEIWTEPWTSTLVSAIFAKLIFDIACYAEAERAPPAKKLQLAVWSSLGGVVFLTRPGDAVVISPLFLYVLWKIWATTRKSGHTSRLGQSTLQTIALVLPGLIGIVLFAAFNIVVHKSIGGRYFSMAETNGFHLPDLLEKTVSLLLDAGTLYGVPNESVFAKLKWLAAVIPAAIFCLISGNTVLRLVIAVFCTQLVIYAPYSDLLPNGMWMYHNIHYFKWVLPYAALLIFYWIKNNPFRQGRATLRNSWAISTVIGLLVLSAKLSLQEIDPKLINANISSTSENQTLRIETSSIEITVDKILFPSLTGDYGSTYFSSEASVSIDGKKMHWVKDFRFLPTPNGTSLIFIRPIAAKTIDIQPGKMKFSDGHVNPRLFTYHFTLGKPSWLKR